MIDAVNHILIYLLNEVEYLYEFRSILPFLCVNIQFYLIPNYGKPYVTTALLIHQPWGKNRQFMCK